MRGETCDESAKSCFNRLHGNKMKLRKSFTLNDTLLFDAFAAIPEMHDRIIAGAAFIRQIPILTKDQSIVSSALVQTIW